MSQCLPEALPEVGEAGWNRRLQCALNVSCSASGLGGRDAELSALVGDFLLEVERIAQQLVESQSHSPVPPPPLEEVLGFGINPGPLLCEAVHSGVSYQLALGQPLGDDADEWQMREAGKERRAAQRIATYALTQMATHTDASKIPVCGTLLCLIDHHGFRVSARSLRPDSAHTPRDVSSRALSSSIEWIEQALCLPSGSTKTDDVKLHTAQENRCYASRVGSLLPQQAEGTSQDKTNSNSLLA
eukprot:gnl/MRDRNA2_/MRDRNA2_76856_c0_seq1.p1 gnl/MRDRNA2_/MRDRNA2_76856_c0~~gnl/MRDRNA2_/MRDRNA2_76856_c0_seq1.p1  ORF type:complete len:244 (+),score=30.96 gnl/MRDRNA2_/MRDRNA2_76856_c0_seq1:62-793(+)